MNIEVIINIREDANLEMLEEKTSGLAEYLDKNLPGVFLNIAQSMVSDAQANAPVKTGLLRSSIHAEVTVVGVDIVCDVPYASFQEYGTGSIMGSYFMRDAIESNYDALREAIERAIHDYFRELEE